MGGSVGKSNSKSGSGFSFSQRIPKFQKDALKGLYGSLQNLFNTTNAGMQSQIPGAVDYSKKVANMVPGALQNNLNGGVYGGLNIGNELMNSLKSTLNSPSNTQKIFNSVMGGEGNDYADAMRGQFTSDANRAEDLMLGNLDARAAAAGMSGGSRHGVATALGMQDINNNLQRNLNTLGYETFDKDLQNKLSIANMADQNTLARQGMLQQMLGAQQGTSETGINQSPNVAALGMSPFAAYMMPWQAAAGLANGIGSPTVLSSGSGYGNSSGKGASTGGGIGGGKNT